MTSDESLRELRSVLLREAMVRGSRLTSLASLQERVRTLLSERGLVGAVLRVPTSAPLETLLDTGLFAPAEGTSNAPGPGLSREVFEQSLASREPIYLKASELGRLFGDGADAGTSEVVRIRERLGSVAGLVVPVSEDAVLPLIGPDLSPDDFAAAEELGQLLLLLQQKFAHESNSAAVVDDLRDSVAQLSLQLKADNQNLSRLLHAAQDLRAGADLENTLQRIGELIRDNLGYDIVAISVIEGKLVHNKALVGVDESVRAHYAGMTSTLEDLVPFLDPRFQISSSYFIPRDADVYSEENRYLRYAPELEERPAGMWQRGDNFLSPLRDGEGRLIGAISLDAPRDGLPPTVEKAQLLELYANHAALTLENSRQVRELTKLNQELQELDRIRNEFIANVSHELRTPVASILGYAHLLLEHGSENLTERQRHFLSVLAKNTERLSSLVDNLVDISEVNTSDPTLRCEVWDLREIYREVFARLEAQVRVHRLEVREDLGTEPLLVLGDRHRLRQVFFAVLSNAVLFNREGGLIDVHMERTSTTMISLRVSDSGLGLSKEKLNEILDRFYQADHAQLPMEIHASAGLSIAYKNVRAHRGNLVIQSDEGTGTRVIVTLPALNSI